MPLLRGFPSVELEGLEPSTSWLPAKQSVPGMALFRGVDQNVRWRCPRLRQGFAAIQAEIPASALPREERSRKGAAPKASIGDAVGPAF